MTTRTASSEAGDLAKSSKRQKVTETVSNGQQNGDGRDSDSNSSLPFADGLLEPSNVQRLHAEHELSGPYKHAIVRKLFQDSFLKRARKEIVEQLSFREKETDIYRINQTGDLSNLSGLPPAELAVLPTLLELRDALYSAEFRTFLQQVTGCGPLSGSKTDMSCAEYSEGCYLLNHDDVIGTRRISFILYLPLDEPAWRPEWGGALELYPVLEADDQNPDRPNVPHAKPTKSIPPSFNQFAFFKVQPGHSFHSVEEVVVQGDGKKGGRGARVSLSGWFHKPVQGEEGYEGEEKHAPKSSLQQLYRTTLEPPSYYEAPTMPVPDSNTGLLMSSADIEYLAKFLSPAYLRTSTITQLRPRFGEESQLLLANFLKPEIADELERLVRATDAKMEHKRRGELVGGRVVQRIPAHSEGEDDGADDDGTGWRIVGPPHIQRFCALPILASPVSTVNREIASSDPATDLKARLREMAELVRSEPFRRFMAVLTSLWPLAYTMHIRRFRPGLDYTLARGEPQTIEEQDQAQEQDGAREGEARLDVGLGLTPVPVHARDEELWEEGECGGWEMWLASEEGGDEATYGDNGKKDKKSDASAQSGDPDRQVTDRAEAEDDHENKEEEEEEDEEEDGPLLAFRPNWNTLSLVLRDPGVLKFVKYVNSKAPGSRWDISGEWLVDSIETEDETGGEEA